ncbi:MAG: CpsB/CapC family capsule biosynthesis tyrosine phosphatase [Thermodesulfobacteriota bacterium]|nr:CpsB/CapC family capsule biosynthesis tyrosine phosphatase [Thermodesulfobacteriota bacterium]
MIDIHCHILAGIDDGADRLQTSLAMATMAARDGITTIIATPHTDGVIVNQRVVQQAVDQLNTELAIRGIDLEIAAGYEIPAHLVCDLQSHTIADSCYILVEFPHQYLPEDAVETLYTLVQAGRKPIIAHPERNASVLRNPDLLRELVAVGGMVQLTAASVTGDFGPDIQHCANYLLRNQLVHFLATDSHSPTFRKPVLSPARKAAARLIGREEADRLVTDNPQAILNETV